MAHGLWLLRDRTVTNITPLIGSLSRRSNVDELGEEISFDIAYNDTRYFPKNPCQLGDVVILKNGNQEITRAVIVEESKNGRSPIGYTAFDYAFYLNKSNAVYQFKNIAADKAIRKILADFKIPVGSISGMSKRITKIFMDEKVSDIIKDIIKLVEKSTGQRFIMEMRQGKLFIEKRQNLLIKGSFSLYGSNNNDITSAISNPSKTRSIVDMVNSIQIISNDKLILTKQDGSMQKKYGKLQKVISLDEKEKKFAARIAQNELNALSKITEEVSLDLMGDDRFRAGRLFQVVEPITGIKGTYLIKNVSHSISGGLHRMSLGLGAV